MKIINWIKNEINSIVNHWEFKRLVKLADRLHSETGYQFHVVPFSKNKLIVVSKNHHVPGQCLSLNLFNKTFKGKQKQITYVDILKIAYYSTGSAGLKRKI